MVGYPHDVCATLVARSVSGHADCYCSFQGSQSGDTLGGFSPSEVCMAASSTFKTSCHRERLHVSTNLIFSMSCDRSMWSL